MFGGVLNGQGEKEKVEKLLPQDPTYDKMEAGYNALFQPTGEQMMQTYFDVLREKDESGWSTTSQGMKDALHQEEMEAIEMEASNIISNQNLPMEERADVAAISQIYPMKESSMAVKLGRDYIMQEDDVQNIPASDEYDSSRSAMADIITNVYDYRAAQQAVLDGEAAKGSPRAVEMVDDFAQMLVPFLEQSNVAEALARAGSGEDSLGSFFLMGGAKEDFFNAFKKMPLNQRAEALQKFIDISETSNRTMFMDNGIMAKQMKDELLYGGTYDTADKWIDNLVSIIDLSVIGKVATGSVRAAVRAKKATKVVEGARGVARELPTIMPDSVLSTGDRVRTGVSPVSPMRMASETNAEKSKAIYAMVAKGEGDEVAEAVAGATKNDAISDAIMPELSTAKVEDGYQAVRSKTHNIESVIDKERLTSSEIKTALDRSNINALSRKELESANVAVVNRLQEAVGVSSRTEMFQFTTTPTGAKISGVYGPAKGGWADAEEALTLVEKAVAQHGVTREELYLMERSKETGEYVRVDSLSKHTKEVFVDVFEADTRGGGQQYHGTSSRINSLEEYTYSDWNIYGQGLYTTDSTDIAKGYSRKGRGTDAAIHKVQKSKDLKLFDLETKLTMLSPELKEKITGVDDLIASIVESGEAENVRELYDIFRQESAAEGLSTYDVQDVFSGIQYNLEEMGYGGIRHIGGLNTGNAPHNVEIIFNPKKHASVDKGTSPLPIKNEVEVVSSDFVVGMDYDYRVNYSDVTSWDEHAVNFNFLDKLPIAAKASVNRNFFDPASMLDPQLTLGANAKVDRSAKIGKDFMAIGKTFSDSFAAADEASKSKMYKYILEANENQIPHSEVVLRGDYGFSTKEIDTIKSFREYWDNVWASKNVVDARSMANEGYGVLVDAKTQTKLYTKPIKKGAVDFAEPIFDAAKGVAEKIAPSKIDELYEQGYTISRTRVPQNLNGIVTDQVLVRNNGDWRLVKDTDVVYPYREGYFQRTYTSPYFIEKEIKTAGGKTYKKAVATAENRTDAELYLKRMAKVDDGVYTYRGDLKNPKEQAKLEMDTYEANGAISMRTRGEKLEDATAVVQGIENTNVLGPVDSIITSSRSMGARIGMTDTIDAMKKRFMEQYKDLLSENRGITKYPTHMDDIALGQDQYSARAADARTTYEYISFLEFGYINGMDAFYKQVLRGLADTVATRTQGKGTRNIEKGLIAASKLAPTSLMKNLAFQMYIATNPLRQFVLNAHQATLLTANFPKYVASQKLAADIHAFAYMTMGNKVPKSAVKLTGKSEAELKLMYKEFAESGLPASIDQNSLIRGSLMDVAESNKYKGSDTIFGKGLEKVRKAGFDSGEWINLTSSWLAHYDELRGTKAGLNASDFDRIAGKARNYTFNMNRAGDMPYNSNSLSLLFQFMQVPHKSLLQMTNRAMPKAEKVKLGMYNAMMFTLPPAAMYSMFSDILPDQSKHPEAHQAVVQGLEFFLFNKMLELTTGEKVDVDFGNLAPMDSYGLFEMVHSMLTTETGSLLAGTPSGQLFAGSNPRITNLMHSIRAFFHPDEERMEGEGAKVLTDFAKLSSGMSNMLRAKMALEAGKLLGSRKQVLDDDVSTTEAVMLAFGFRTMESAQKAWVGGKLYEEHKAFTDDVNEWYNQLTRGLTEYSTAEEQAYHVAVMSKAWKVWGSNAKAHAIIEKNLRRDYQKGSSAIHDYILQSVDYMTPDEVVGVSNAIAGDDPERHEKLKSLFEAIKNYEEVKGDK